MNWTRNPGRVVGVLYLLLLVAPLRLIYIPTKLIVRGDATATADNIAAHETLFRLGMASELFTGVVLIFLVLAFYRLFAAGRNFKQLEGTGRCDSRARSRTRRKQKSRPSTNRHCL